MAKAPRAAPRPKRAKTGGRKPGSVNKANALIRDRIETQADPIGFLTRIMRGEEIECAPPRLSGSRGGDPVAVPEGVLPTMRVRPTLDQMQAAANKLADKLLPNPRSRAVPIDLPRSFATDADVIAAADRVLEGMASGVLTIDEADQAMGVIAKRRQIFESEELQRRIEALEAATQNPGAG